MRLRADVEDGERGEWVGRNRADRGSAKSGRQALGAGTALISSLMRTPLSAFFVTRRADRQRRVEPNATFTHRISSLTLVTASALRPQDRLAEAAAGINTAAVSTNASAQWRGAGSRVSYT